MENFDVIIIGGGPGGYTAALKCAINGLKAAIVERENFGGTCLNRGCIPTKVLYSKARYLKRLKEPENGFKVEKFSFDFKDIINYKDGVVSSLVGGVEKLLKARNVKIIKGTGRIAGKDPLAVMVRAESGSETRLEAKNIVVATGSFPLLIPSFNIDHRNILTSDEILFLEEAPKSLIIIGAGVIGCEFANIFNEFGSRVAMIELLPDILSTEDREISRFIRKELKSRGIDVITSALVEKIHSKGDSGGIVSLKDGTKLEAEKVLISIGRGLNTASIGLSEMGVSMDEKGRLKVNEYNETSLKGVYACGDIIDGPMLAHKASYDGIIAADNISGKKVKKNYSILPWSVYTSPPIGTVGLKEGDKGLEGLDYSVGRFSYAASGMALAMEESEGFLKVLVDRGSGRIIGATGCGADVPELVAEISSFMHFNGTISDMETTIHSHPTLSEIVAEATMDSIGEAIHKVNPRTARQDKRK